MNNKKLLLSALILSPLSNLQASQATPLSPKVMELQKRAQELLAQARKSLRAQLLISKPVKLESPKAQKTPLVLLRDAAGYSFEEELQSVKLPSN